jgi:hypothetical protein
MRLISQILLEDYGIALRPGHKGPCPQCQSTHFSIKADDSIGKCFSAGCGFVLTTARDQTHYHASLTRALESVFEVCHQEFLTLASGTHNAYTYCREERGIHPQVLADAMLGAVPSSFDTAPHFQPVLDAAEQAVQALQTGQRGRPTRQLAQTEQRLQDLKDAKQKLHDCCAHKAGWLMFFYTDAHHRPVALRLRQPYEKRFVSCTRSAYENRNHAAA